MKYVLAFVFCMFMGVLGISLGGGTAYPPMNRIAQPFVCPGGTMTYATKISQTRRGKNLIEAVWTCEAPSGKKAPIDTFSVALYAGSIYGLGLFVLVAASMALGARKAKAAP